MSPDLPDLPVRAHLDRIVAALDEHGSAVLVAPPGTGKTTLVPLAMAAAADGRVVVAEPRRLAARAAAARMAALLGERVGETVGYAVRGDRKVSARTRVEVVTSGLLLRRLAGDPELDGISAVVLDECHERHLDADLLLALLLDARAGLRPDLRLLATSATVATRRLTELLDGPVLDVPGVTFPVDVRHLAPVRGERIEACVARAVRTLLDGDGDVLAFLPGVAEIRRTQNALSGLDADVLPLHGRLPAAEQDRALSPGPRRRIVLATAVAESSLTVPGVRAVVDAGLARVPRTDHRRGLAGLVTVRVSAAVADQRAGRAGREGPGRVLRCWPEGELLPRYPEPEIRTADLTRLALDLAEWGTPDGSGLAWWDPPPEGPLRVGQEVLRALGALDGGTITDRGRRMAALGLHPRLARALLDGSALAGRRTAAEVVALMDGGDSGDTSTDSDDVETALRKLRSGGGRWKQEVRRLEDRIESTPRRAGTSTRSAATVVALAQPERIARRRPGGGNVYLMAGGTAVELAAGSPLAGQEWLAVAVADRTPGALHGRVRLAAAADRELAELAAPALLAEADEVAWDRGDVVARHVRRLGAIVLEERRLDRPDPERLKAALLDGLRAEGMGLLRWTAHARALRDRLTTLHRVLGDPWPDVSDDALAGHPEKWWSGPLTTARNRADLAKIDAGPILRALLTASDYTGRVAGRLDELAPERVELPSGRRVAVDYSADPPVLAVKLQEVLGATTTPSIAGGRLPLVLHLLSPAGRTAAVTGDLASFWTTGYPQVRTELRGRYPKHAWPEDPLAVR